MTNTQFIQQSITLAKRMQQIKDQHALLNEVHAVQDKATAITDLECQALGVESVNQLNDFFGNAITTSLDTFFADSSTMINRLQ